MKKGISIALLALISVMFMACGGGGGGGLSSGASSFKLSGFVPGTLIEAFCKDGSYYKTNSKDNGTSNHPFELELPLDVDCKLVMTTNEKDPDVSKRIVTPISFSDGGSTSTYINLNGDIELGYVGLATTGSGIQPILDLAVTNNKLKIKTYSLDPLDDDKDGIPNVYEDDDGDGKYNKDDDDDDGDGIKDSEDKDNRHDKDGDGIDDEYDKDDDGDGIEDSKDDDYEGDGGSVTITLPTSYSANAGRLLGSQCAQCHGTNGVSVNSWDGIAGEDELLDEIHGEDAIMDAQADGYTNSEILLIESWLKTLPSDDD